MARASIADPGSISPNAVRMGSIVAFRTKPFSTVAKQMAMATVVFHGRQPAGRNHQQPGRYAVDDSPTEKCILIILGKSARCEAFTLPVTTLSAGPPLLRRPTVMSASGFA
jgi:hypothetical protein